MFYPATSHVSRTYGAPTTGRRKLAVHNENDLGAIGGGGLPSKTPSRPGGSGKSAQLVPVTNARVGLGAKTEGRDRNVLARQEGGNAKGKGKTDEIEPKRLFASSSTLPPSKSLSNLPQIPSTRTAIQPTKTPGRPPPSSRKLPPNNLRTPAPSTFRISADVSSTPLPSATRRRKSRSSGHGSVGGTTPVRPTSNDEFRTPAPSAKWEEGDSLGSIDELVAEGGIELDVLGEVEEESDPEIEYMPPKVPEMPYEPDWDMDVDVLHVTRRLQGLPAVVFGVTQDATPVFEPQLEQGSSRIELTSDESLEDPIFQQAPPTIVPLPASTLPAPPVSTASTARPTTLFKVVKSSNRPPIHTASSMRNPKTLPSTTSKSRPPLPSSMRPPAPPRPALSARPINKNLPMPKSVRPVTLGAGKAKVKDEDEEMRQALEDVAAQEIVFDLGF